MAVRHSGLILGDNREECGACEAPSGRETADTINY